MTVLLRFVILFCLLTLAACGGGADSAVTPLPDPQELTLSVSHSGPVSENSAGSFATFRIAASRSASANISIAYSTLDGSAQAGADYMPASGSVSLPAGLSSVEIDVPLIDDSLDEPDETFSLQLTSTSSGRLGASSVSATIVDDDPAVSIQIGDASMVEGDSGQTSIELPVTLSDVSGFDISVDHSTVDGTATAGSDFDARSGTLVIAAGSTAATIGVPVFGDTVVEANESFNVQLSNAVHATLARATATALITDNDNPDIPPNLSVSVVAAGSVSEGSPNAVLVFPITLSEAASVDIDVQYASGSLTAVEAQDFAAASGSLTIPAGSVNASVTVQILDDALFESDESVLMQILSVSGGSIALGTATGNIVNDDTPPMVSLSDASLTEGDAGQQALLFTLSQSAVSGLDSSVSYTTADGTALAGDDYQTASGTATIAAGSTQTTIQVDVSGDTLNEADETLQLILDSAQNASIAEGSATGTIVNNDAPPSLSIADTSIAEGDSGLASLVFTLSLDAASGIPVTVDYATSDGTAISGEDFTASGGTATIAVGATSTTVAVTIAGDSLYEFDETFSVGLSNPVNGLIATGSAIGTISNDDSAPVISITDESIAEGDAGQASLSFTVSLDAVSGVETTLSYATADGTATAGFDYVATSGQLTIPAGDLQASILVPVIGDAVDEPSEIFTVLLSDAVNASVADGSGTGTIVDDEAQPVVSIADASASEGNGGSTSLSFAITLGSVSSSDVNVDYSTSDLTADSADDYVAASGTATIPAGQTATTIDVLVSGDAVFESNETLQLVLSAPVNAVVGDGTATGTILNDDVAPALSISDASLAEGDTGTQALTFTVSLSAVSGLDASANFTTVDVTTTSGDDYAAASGTVTIPAGSTNATIEVAVSGDVVSEPDETLQVVLSSATNSSIGDGTGVGTIIDNDALPSLSIADGSIAEGDSGSATVSLTVSLSGVSGSDVTVDFASSDGTATGGSDYVTAAGQVSIPAGSQQATIDIAVLGDTLDEPDEAFNVGLSGASSATIADGNAIVTIIDNDAPPSLSVEDTSIAEGNSGSTSLIFDIALSSISANDVTVNYATADGTAVAGEDYAARSGVATILAGTLRTAVPVPVSGDVLFENHENLSLTLTSPTNAIISDGNAIGTLTNDDAAPVISITDASQGEGDTGQADMPFTVSLDAVSGLDVTVTYSTTDESATSGEDYTASSGQLTIPAGSQQATVNVAISGDTVDEPDESFAVILSDAVNASIATGSATGLIVDDEAQPVVSISDASVTEGNSGLSTLSFELSIGSSSASDISVSYATVDDSATAGEDYSTVSGTATILAGQTATIIDVLVSGDAVFESNETLQLVLSAPVNAVVGDGTATGTILNDDVAPALSISDASLAEGDTGTQALTFTVSLSAVSGLDASANFTTVDVTTTSGDDYAAASGTVTIPAGSTNATIEVAVSGDVVSEPDETLQVVLSSATNSSIGDGTGVGTIIDNDALPSLSIADGSIAEGDSGSATVSLTVSLSGVSGSDVTVDFASSDDTATGGSDYVTAAGQVTIPAGSQQATIDIAVLGDTLDEPDEAFNVGLSGASNATIADGNAIVTIIDNDAPPSLSIADASITEGNSGISVLVFTISLSAPSGNTVTVDYLTADGTASDTEDYSASSGVATIAAGNTDTTISVNVLGDALYESDESFSINLSTPVNATVLGGSAIGGISNDDAPPEISIADASITEVDAGESDIVFTLSLSNESGVDATVSFATSDGSATAGLDYVSESGVATIPAGALQALISVATVGDTLNEADESFELDLTNPSGATILDGTATGEILDNDPIPDLSVADASLIEGDSGQAAMSFTITLSTASSFDVSVEYSTSNDTAEAGTDYLATSGTALILAGSISATVSVLINGDTDDEGDEQLTFGLSNSVNAGIADGVATGIIFGDDGVVQSGLASRPSNTSCVAPARPSNNTAIDNELAFPNLPALTKLVQLIKAPNDSSLWYAVEQDGRILSFVDAPGSSSISTFIDLRSGGPIDVDSSALEAGLFSMAFDPGYGNENWDVYLSYTVSGSPLTSKITRFESTDNGLTLDPSTAVELISLDQPFENHNGGHIAFGPDGYLYIHFGDGGSGGDPGNRAQNTQNLFGAMLRISVDGAAPYAIPPDNEFSGHPLCEDGSGVSDCPEIYAWGLRNSWRWSFDPDTENLWLGDVGQNEWEEVNIIEAGGNYGWRCREGSNSYNSSGNCPAGLIDPVIEYSNRSVGDSITGGRVYRGSAIPELAGRYVFADYSRGKLFASVDNGDGTYSFETLQETSQLISSFAAEDDGELLYLDYIAGQIRRIIQAGGTSINTIPDELSATGCVSASDITQPASGLIPYDINVPFWSDGAVKERYYSIPDGTTIDVAADGDWLFPNGTVLVKNFRLNGNLIETRLFMRHTDGEWGGYTYEWNAGETEATRVIGGKTKDIDGQDWIYPSESQCIQCHTAVANFSLGLEHGQLNKDLTYPSTGITANQLVTADTVDLLSDTLGDSVDNLPRYPDPENVAETLEDRARAYLHTNCAGCHRPFGPTPSDMDLRYPTPLNQTGTCNVIPNSVTLGIPNARLIMPGDSAGSLVVERASRRDIHGMPPLGSTVVDSTGVQLIADWIDSLSGCP